MKGVAVEIEETPDGRVLRVEGELDLETVAAFEKQLERSLAVEEPVAVDLSECSFVDSAALRALVRADDALAKTGRRLVVRNPSVVVRRALELSGLVARLVLDPA